jgi:hypothetical protein
VVVLIIHQHNFATTHIRYNLLNTSTTPSFNMYTTALLILAPIAAQAAQSARWPVFNLRANVTQDYTGYGLNTRATWHNAPLELGGGGPITGPLVDEECSQRAVLSAHGK